MTDKPHTVGNQTQILIWSVVGIVVIIAIAASVYSSS